MENISLCSSVIVMVICSNVRAVCAGYCYYNSYYFSYYCYYYDGYYHSYLNAASIVGIVIGSLVGASLFISLVICLCCQGCKKKTKGTIVHPHSNTSCVNTSQQHHQHTQVSTNNLPAGSYPVNAYSARLPPLHHTSQLPPLPYSTGNHSYRVVLPLTPSAPLLLEESPPHYDSINHGHH